MVAKKPAPRRRKRRGPKTSAIVIACLIPANLALLVGAESYWPLFAGAVGAVLVIGGEWLWRKRRHSSRIVAKPELKTTPRQAEIPTPRTRLKAKLAAAAELAHLHGWDKELEGAWAAIDLADAETADVVTQREIEDMPTAEFQALQRKSYTRPAMDERRTATGEVFYWPDELPREVS